MSVSLQTSAEKQNNNKKTVQVVDHINGGRSVEIIYLGLVSL